MPVHTRTQKIAQSAFEAVDARLHRLSGESRGKYTSFAREFPSLVHTCGLAQAVAFAIAKDDFHKMYAEDLAAVLHGLTYDEIADAVQLARKTRDLEVAPYLRLSRDALAAAVWLKRHVEAAEED